MANINKKNTKVPYFLQYTPRHKAISDFVGVLNNKVNLSFNEPTIKSFI